MRLLKAIGFGALWTIVMLAVMTVLVVAITFIDPLIVVGFILFLLFTIGAYQAQEK